MRYFFYIALIVICYSCAQKNDNMDGIESHDATDLEMVQTEDAAAAMEESEDTVSSIIDVMHPSTIVIKQQLQEVINLIVLKNKMDLDTALALELNKTIADKVNDYSIPNSIDVLDINHIQIEYSKAENSLQMVNIDYIATGIDGHEYTGKANAKVTTTEVDIDGETFTDFQVYFEDITIKD